MGTWRPIIGWSLLASLPLVCLVALLARLLPDPSYGSPHIHFAIVTTSVGLLAIIALLMTSVALQVDDIRVFYLALTFLAVAGIFIAHALSTPSIIVPFVNPWGGFSAYLSLFAGGVCLLASTIAWPRRAERWILARQGRVFGVALVVIVAYDLTALRIAAAPRGLSWPTLPLGSQAPLPAPVPATELSALVASDTLLRGFAATTIVVAALASWRFFERYRQWPSPLHAGLLGAAIFLTQAQITLATTTIWHLSWWGYHLLIIMAFVAAAFGLGREYARSGNLAGVVEGLLLRDTIRQLERGYAEVIVALVAAVEARDPYTRGHTQRVADLAVRIGQHLHLSAQELRTVSQAAILHDIGKIGVPDAILNKTGALTAEERVLVQEHTLRGCEIIRNIRSLRKERDGVRSHHERLDGSGYPDGLRGEQIPLVARIIAVADVYDALTSRRSYRQAIAPGEALAMIEADAFSKLDARCVTALRHILQERGIGIAPSPRRLAPDHALSLGFDPDAEPRPHLAGAQVPVGVARTIR